MLLPFGKTVVPEEVSCEIRGQEALHEIASQLMDCDFVDRSGPVLLSDASNEGSLDFNKGEHVVQLFAVAREWEQFLQTILRQGGLKLKRILLDIHFG